MEQESAQSMPWVAQVSSAMDWQGPDSSGGAPEAKTMLSSQRYITLGGGSELPSDGRGTVIDDVTPATHAPAGDDADAAAGAASNGVPSNDETQVAQHGAKRLPRQ